MPLCRTAYTMAVGFFQSLASKRVPKWKLQSLCNPVSDVISHHFCRILFIRIIALGPPRLEGRELSKSVSTRRWESLGSILVAACHVCYEYFGTFRTLPLLLCHLHRIRMIKFPVQIKLPVHSLLLSQDLKLIILYINRIRLQERVQTRTEIKKCSFAILLVQPFLVIQIRSFVKTLRYYQESVQLGIFMLCSLCKF